MKSAVVIGGGFIGLETAENLKEAGLEVTLVQRGGHLLNIVDGDMAAFIHATFRSNGVKLMLNAQTKKLSPLEKGICVEFADGEKIVADMVLLAIGVVPGQRLARRGLTPQTISAELKANIRVRRVLP